MTAAATEACDLAGSSALTQTDGSAVSLAWMVFAVAVQTKGLGFLLVAAM
jgi:hypothetical protein